LYLRVIHVIPLSSILVVGSSLIALNNLFADGLTTVQAAALIEKAGLVSANKGKKKGKEGPTQAEVDKAEADLEDAREEARKAKLHHAVAKEAVERRKWIQPEVEVEQDDGGGGVGIEAVKRAKTTRESQAKKRETTEKAHGVDGKKVKKEKDTGDGDGSEPWHWANVMKGSDHVGEEGVVTLEKFSEVQVRHSSRVQQ
jgi:hypothetical protein